MPGGTQCWPPWPAEATPSQSTTTEAVPSPSATTPAVLSTGGVPCTVENIDQLFQTQTQAPAIKPIPEAERHY
jgi:hypothetical protein